MTRLGLLIVFLAVVVAAAIVVQLRVAPTVARPVQAGEAPKKLSRADQQRLEVLKTKFVQERDAYLKMRSAGAPADQQEAQNAKALAAAQAVINLGGTEAIKSVGKSKYATTVNGPADKMGKPAPDPSPKAGASCAGEEGGSCSGEGGACSVDLGSKAPKKTEAKDAKPAAAAKPASPTKP
jgi:hypothetical protein